jgi:hypothetical protein
MYLYCIGTGTQRTLVLNDSISVGFTLVKLRGKHLYVTPAPSTNFDAAPASAPARIENKPKLTKGLGLLFPLIFVCLKWLQK